MPKTISKYFKPRYSKSSEEKRAALRRIAEATLDALERGSFDLSGVTHDLQARNGKSIKGTRYYAPDSLLSTWSRQSQPLGSRKLTDIQFSQISTLKGAEYFVTRTAGSGKIGVLNFASATKPGGGFIEGASAQEESIARSSNLYLTLMTEGAQQFYDLHNGNRKSGYYSHAMIYSPSVTIFRDDGGDWVKPHEVDVLTSPAVNAGLVHELLGSSTKRIELDAKIEKEMKERMARILFLFEKEGAKNLVLGSYGTGVFRNKVEVVARLWADLLTSARFESSFDGVLFAVIDEGTHKKFEEAFNSRVHELRTSAG